MVVITICLLYKMIIIVIPTIPFGSNRTFPSETSHVETENNIGNSSRKQTFKEVKKVFYSSLREYRRRKRVPVLLSNNSKLSGTFHELFPKCRRGLFLLIMVPSRPSALNNRNAIRLSWANATHGKLHQSMDHGRTNFTYNVIFVMGRSKRNEIVAEESRRFGDILLLNYGDKNSELAQTIQSLSRIALTCSPIFFLKTDNDTFINVNAVAEWLTKQHPNIQHAEKLATKSPDIGNYKDVSREGHQATGYYGVYLTERSYILAGKIMKNISEASTKIPAMANENAYIRTLVNFLGIKPRELQDPRFMSHVFENVKIRDFDPCDWRKKFFIHHVFRVKHILMHSKTVVFSKLAHLCRDE